MPVPKRSFIPSALIPSYMTRKKEYVFFFIMGEICNCNAHVSSDVEHLTANRSIILPMKCSFPLNIISEGMMLLAFFSMKYSDDMPVSQLSG